MAVDLLLRSLAAAPGVEPTLVDPRELDLRSPGLEHDPDGPRRLTEALAAADGIVLATPEYHGGLSSVMKLVFENLGHPTPLRGKPVALLGVAAGVIGAIKSLEQVRSIASHMGALVLPGPVSVARCQEVFTPEGACLDDEVARRIEGLGEALVDYVRRHACPRASLEGMVRGNEELV